MIFFGFVRCGWELVGIARLGVGRIVGPVWPLALLVLLFCCWFILWRLRTDVPMTHLDGRYSASGPIYRVSGCVVSLREDWCR